jgi:class 3 adenylate cyclase
MTSRQAAKREYAVVFADITGSTQLYETVGDDAAKALILAVENEIADVVCRTGGVVQEIVGDEVMFHFESVNPAISCACEIQRAIESLSEKKGSGFAVRIGLHFGPAILEGGRMFGDTVNTAARMAGIAQGGQIITTGELVRNLTGIPATMVRRFDEVKVKGKRDALVIYEVLWRHTNLTFISHLDSMASEVASTLVLRHREQAYRLRPSHGVFTIGRSTANDLVIVAGSISRKHASIEFSRGRFMLADSSTNGTYVEALDGPCVFFRRETTPLIGRGRIGLGAPPSDGGDYVIQFECE